MNDDENIKLYLQLFKGREDYFAEQLQDRYSPVRKPFDEFYLRQHVGGDATYGLYVLDSKSLCHLLCVDIDIPKDDIEGVDIKDRVAKYSYLKTKLQAVVETLLSKLGVPPESILLEETGGRGYHIWIFLAGPLDGMVAVNFGEILIEHLGFHLEVFPKQGNLNEKRKLGNLIKLPLGVHKKYGSRSVFFSLSNAGPLLIDGLTENFQHLRSLVPVTPDIIAKATEAFGVVSADSRLLASEILQSPLPSSSFRIHNSLFPRHSNPNSASPYVPINRGSTRPRPRLVTGRFGSQYINSLPSVGTKPRAVHSVSARLSLLVGTRVSQ